MKFPVRINTNAALSNFKHPGSRELTCRRADARHQGTPARWFERSRYFGRTDRRVGRTRTQECKNGLRHTSV